MLFPYTYVPHQMEKMQSFIDFIFFEVWPKALTEQYGIHLFAQKNALYQIMDELYRRDLAGTLRSGAGKWFYEAVNEIFNEFKKLNNAEIDEYCQSYRANNLIETLCKNVPGSSPVRYSDLNSSKTDLNNRLSDFFKKLYSSGFFRLSFVKKALGSDLSTYYTDFIRANKPRCCPFCGLFPIDTEFDPTREAFDHYLPKSKYPFNSVNLKNLAPSCNKCNSGNKKDKDPLHTKEGTRRKAFFPFSKVSADVQIRVDVINTNYTDPTPADLNISISSPSHIDEIQTWNDLFQIEERYSARCCSASGGLYWRARVLNECQNYDLSVQEMMDAEVKSAQSNPWSESNFLKIAFLEGCHRAGLFHPVSTEESTP
ncbi:HNH endonuclease [Desulfobacula toluolica]|uniref:Conserved uncharacterized protein n=1 Tax=Desulfobacula toluolica (strain DSM 7467 / Tol2) TaxID=651182 RepID=K0NH68_DESTT|nr:hypothetical protein [Desulfobacula toluolica]CCK78352.1 conserved uncharacterized protein [Desulfobacula toluolica Tol2]